MVIIPQMNDWYLAYDPTLRKKHQYVYTHNVQDFAKACKKGGISQYRRAKNTYS